MVRPIIMAGPLVLTLFSLSLISSLYTTGSALSLLPSGSPASEPTVYYFAFGSNMLPSTMKLLRNINVDTRINLEDSSSGSPGLSRTRASAAILPDYRLAFNGMSAASAMPCPGDCIHGVLYQLSLEELARVGLTEGVPFAYRWERCQVYPYVGNGECAGEQVIQNGQIAPLEALCLTAPRSANAREMPRASPWYARILQRGAAAWKLDRAYQERLANLPLQPSTWSDPFLKITWDILLDDKID